MSDRSELLVVRNDGPLVYRATNERAFRLLVPAEAPMPESQGAR